MKFVKFKLDGIEQLGVLREGSLYVRTAGDRTGSAIDLGQLVASGKEALNMAASECLQGSEVDMSKIEYLPPFANPEKIICVGLNYNDHAKESGFQTPVYPALFGRFPSSLIGHKQAILRPRVSDLLDYEGELVAIIGKAGRDIVAERALDHVAGYSIFNDASVRDYQFKSAQWMIGKNFDDTGAFGPYFVTADELPAGAKGLHIETRLNGKVMQTASTSDLIFDVATLVSLLSECMELKPGDVIVTGTPSGVGFARDPKVLMKPGDVCEVEIAGVGLLSNPIAQQP